MRWSFTEWRGFGDFPAFLRALNRKLRELEAALRNFVASSVTTTTLTLNGITIEWPAANAEGYLFNDGTGQLAWAEIDDTEARRLREAQELATLEAGIAALLATEPHESTRHGFELR